MHGGGGGGYGTFGMGTTSMSGDQNSKRGSNVHFTSDMVV